MSNHTKDDALDDEQEPKQMSFSGFAPVTVRFHLFNFEGVPYRARFENGRLIVLCSRKGSLYSWQRIPASAAGNIYLAYLDKVKPKSIELTPDDQST